MLIELRLRNVAVIDAVTLPLAVGLNVLTGETGAGKSLIVGALGMLLGERAAADRVRAGTDKAVVEGVFDIRERASVTTALEALGIDADEDVLVLKREIGANGRSRAWINGAPVTAATLAEVGAQLVSVHGQHDSRQLLEPEHQRDMLDAFVAAHDTRARVRDAYTERQALRARERDLQARTQDVERRADYLRFVAAEIEAARPVPGEEITLDADIRRLSHASELRQLAAQAAAAIGGHDDAVLARLGEVRRALAALGRIDADTERWQSTFDGAVYALDELARELEGYVEGVDADPARLESLEQRRTLLHALQRKYGPTADDVLETLRQSREELALVDNGAIDLRDIAAARAAADGALLEAAAALTRQRSDGARALAASVTALLPDLGMPDGRFDILLTPLDEISAGGAESVQFLATLNAGADARPLSRIASGGELARVMLALSTVLARLQQVPTLVFDEIDAGIGGAVAWQVGALMRRVAGHHQVLAISHLAQIAARAHHHIVVQKSAVGTVTTADTAVVTGEARVVEIARMLGGDADREISRAHARELLERGELAVAETSVAETSDAAAATKRRAQRRGKPV